MITKVSQKEITYNQPVFKADNKPIGQKSSVIPPAISEDSASHSGYSKEAALGLMLASALLLSACGGQGNAQGKNSTVSVLDETQSETVIPSTLPKRTQKIIQDILDIAGETYSKDSEDNGDTPEIYLGEQDPNDPMATLENYLQGAAQRAQDVKEESGEVPNIVDALSNGAENTINQD